MARLKVVSIDVYNDVVGMPYVIIEGTTDDKSGTDAVPMEMKFWAHDVKVTDHRKPNGRKQ